MKTILSTFIFAIFPGINYHASASVDNYPNPHNATIISDSLYAHGVDSYKEGNYQEALTALLTADSIDKEDVNPNDLRTGYSTWWIAACHYHLGDTSTAKSLYPYYYIEPVDRRLTKTSDSLYAIGEEDYLKGEYRSAINHFLSCLEIEKEIVRDNTFPISNTVFMIGISYYSMQNYKIALLYQKQYANIIKNEIGIFTPEYIDAITNLAIIYQESKEYQQALQYYIEAINIHDSIYPMSQNNELLLNISNIYNLLGLIEYETSKSSSRTEREYYLQAWNYISKIQYPDSNVMYLRNSIPINITYSYRDEASTKSLQEAKHLLLECINTCKTNIIPENEGYILILNDLAEIYLHELNYEKAIRYQDSAVKVTKRIIGENTKKHLLNLQQLAFYHSRCGNFQTSLRIESYVVEKYREYQYKKSDSTYIQALLDLAYYYQDDHKNALKLIEEAKQIIEENHNTESSLYVLTLFQLSELYQSTGDIPLSISYGEKAMNLIEKTGIPLHYYMRDISFLSTAYSYNNPERALNLIHKAIEAQKHISTQDDTYAYLLIQAGCYHAQLGNYSIAENLTHQASVILEKLHGETSMEYIESIDALADIYYQQRDFEKLDQAFSNLFINLNRYQNELIASDPNLINERSNIALNKLMEINLEKITQAIQIMAPAVCASEHNIQQGLTVHVLDSVYTTLKMLLKLSQSIETPPLLKFFDNPNFSISNLYNQTSIYRLLGERDSTINKYNELLALIEKYLGKNLYYAKILDEIASFYFENNAIDQAIETSTLALKIIDSINEQKSLAYIDIAMPHSLYLFNKSKQETSFIESVSKTTDILSQTIQEKFILLSSEERHQLWNQYRIWFDYWVHSYTLNYDSENLSSNGYNALLFSKNLLLNTEIELSTLIHENGNKDILELYNQWETNKKILNILSKNKSLPKEQDSLYAKEYLLEKQLLTQIQNLLPESSFPNLSLTWQDVQQNLKNEDIAIEYAHFPLNDDSVLYVAYILTKESSAPHMVPLFEEKQLLDIDKNSLYTNGLISQLTLKPLSEFLNGKKNIFFSPTGELYNIAIENTPHWENANLISDNWNLYRISSSRQLAVKQSPTKYSSAVVYGGLDYDATISTTKHNDSIPHANEGLKKRNISTDSLSLRGGFASLPWTKIEAQTITQSLTKAGIKTTFYSDSTGTETSFKNLSGHSPDIIHICTHGFYWQDRYLPSTHFASTSSKISSIPDNSLERSGLLFAGANHALEKKTSGPNMDDGILTAQEITLLNLQNTNLVVLSACETGLGELKGDGVYGLQRGFKQAGAKSIIMSLWKVDDKATRLLMENFYKNYIHGMDKRESLATAQRYLRNYEETVQVKDWNKATPTDHGSAAWRAYNRAPIIEKKVKEYEDPKFWAAFILLDGLD